MPKILTDFSKEICLVEEVCLIVYALMVLRMPTNCSFSHLNGFKSYDMRGHLVRVNRLECPVILLA